MGSIEEMTQLAVTISEHLKDFGIEVVLVGGLAVSCYTDNKFLTKDIGMVDITYSKPKTLNQAMAKLGFRKEHRHFVSDNTDIVVEFPSAPLAVGDEHIQEYDVLTTATGSLPILKAEDLIKDRLSAYFHWQDRQSLAQALGIMLIHGVNPISVHELVLREASSGEFEKLASLHSILERAGDYSAELISNLIESEYLKSL